MYLREGRECEQPVVTNDMGVIKFESIEARFCDLVDSYCRWCHGPISLETGECWFCGSIYKGETVLG